MFRNLENIWWKIGVLESFTKRNYMIGVGFTKLAMFQWRAWIGKNESSNPPVRNNNNLPKTGHDFEAKGLKDWDIWTEWLANMVRLTMKVT